MSDIEMLVIQARGAYSTSRVVTGLAAAVEALQAQLAEANKTIDAIEAMTTDALANADDSGVGWDAEMSASAIHNVLAEYRKKATS